MSDFLYQFIPEDFNYLTQQKKVVFKDKNLKTSYLINILHELLIKYYFSNNYDLKFNLSSRILRKKYGEFYNYYIEYLKEKKFIALVSKYYVGKKTNTYKIIFDNIYDIKRYKNYDNVLLKKSKKYLYDASITEINNSTIPLNIRKILVENLYKIDIDYEKSKKHLDECFKNKEIDLFKYKKNILSIENINIKNIYFKFDSYGRFHTNFTTLKRDIRNNFLLIDNENIEELDINNSQPLFFGILLKKYLPYINGDTGIYFDLVKNGLLYDDIIERSNVKDKMKAKNVVYSVLFGDNKTNKRENKIFKSLYPSVYSYILEFKENVKNYKELSHTLQKMESDFIFKEVISEIVEKYPDIVFFTVHDSILFKKSMKNNIKKIFDKHLNNLKSKII